MKRALCVVAALLLLGSAAACSYGGDGGSTSSVSSGSALPDDFPVFEGSQFDSGAVDERGGVDTFQGVWLTSADAEAVREYFERELNGEWRIIEITDDSGPIVIRVERVGGDEPEQGTVVINDGENGTTIVKTITKGTPDPDDEVTNDDDDDEPSGGSTPGAGVTPGSGASGLPTGYPADRVPLPANATVGTATGPADPGDEQVFSVDFSSTDTYADLVSYFTTTLGDDGWDLTLQNDDGRNFSLLFDDGSGDSVFVTGQSTSAGSVANVTVTLGD